MSATAKIAVSNSGTNRVIVGPPPKSKQGGSAATLRLDTAADDKVPTTKRFGKEGAVEGAAAAAMRGSKAFQAAQERFNLRVS